MEDYQYYFFNFNVETAAGEINLPGWQKLSNEEILTFKTSNYKRIVKNNDIYSFSNEDDFDLEQYKRIKIEFISGESFARGEQIIPDYKYRNCLISKSLILRGELPIYDNYFELMHEYENLRRELRNEFYRCKSQIESANSKEEIDNINFEYEKRT